jgi:hypothetical protein
MYEDITCRYFEKPGPKNTQDTMEAASRRASLLGIGTIVVATSSGRTVFEAINIFGPGIKIIAVTHVTGFAKPNFQELADEDRKELESKGVAIFTGQHAFGGIGRSVRNKFGTYQVDEIVSNALKIFGQGTKVAIEIAMMAADAGLVRTDEDVIAIGGSGKGADTALVLRPVNSEKFFDLVVKEVICKPSVK